MSADNTEVGQPMTRRKITNTSITAEDVLAAVPSRGSGTFYYRRPGRPILFFGRDRAVEAIVDYPRAFHTSELTGGQYDIEAIAKEVVHEIKMPDGFYFRDHTGPVFTPGTDELWS